MYGKMRFHLKSFIPSIEARMYVKMDPKLPNQQLNI